MTPARRARPQQSSSRTQRVGRAPLAPADLLATLAKDSQEEDLAARRIGRTAVERARWLMEQIGRDPGARRPEEWSALGWDLRALPRKPGWQGERYPGPMSPEAALELLQEISRGVREFLSQAGTWTIPPPREETLVRVRGSSGPYRAWIIRSHPEERVPILHAVKDLLVETAPQVRACRETTCGKPFVAVRRQEYCSAACSQKRRNKNRKRSPSERGEVRGPRR